MAPAEPDLDRLLVLALAAAEARRRPQFEVGRANGAPALTDEPVLRRMTGVMSAALGEAGARALSAE
jgi:hypothetical protein